tara:strand:- start:3447 stop:3656 length:210 start_codon:yes stop_codon:yes gene_type:complete
MRRVKMSKIYTLRDTFDGSLVKWTLPEILEYINSGRSDEWEDYDEGDWEEGLEVWTEYELVSLDNKSIV